MTEYAGQVLRVVKSTGVVSTTYLTVTDPDGLGASDDTGTIWNTCGTILSQPPALDMRLITGTLLNGASFSLRAVHFFANGRDFYLTPTERAPETIATVTSSVPVGSVAPFDYLGRSMSVDDEALQSGRALTVSFDALHHATKTAVGQVVVSDDDGLIQFGTETGRAAEVLLGPGQGSHAFNQNGGGQMALVEVSYHAASGDGTFEALRYGLTQPGGGTMVYYIPRAGSVDVTQVQSFLGETTLPGSAEGMAWSDFGLGAELFRRNGGAGADFFQGSILNDFLSGRGGNDSLVGGMGADSLVGGTGDDVEQGGMQNDTLIGGDGNDLLQGGNDDDRLQGDAGNDQLIANWGDDLLFGGLGNDKMNGGSDQDTLFGDAGADILIGFDGRDELHDGTGQDTLFGGRGADHFVLDSDGAKDRILDFQDGIDKIALGVAFSALTITTLQPGRVEILYGNDTLWVEDSARLLTAADFSPTDFI